MIPWGKWFIIMAGLALALIGAINVPLMVMDGDIFRLIFYSLMLFGGIGILGYAARE